MKPARFDRESAACNGSPAKIGVGDFNGDGTSDLLWRNGAFKQSVTITAAAPTGFAFEGIGDCFGADVSGVLWRKASSGDLTLWKVANDQVIPSSTLGGPNGASGWEIVT